MRLRHTVIASCLLAGIVFCTPASAQVAAYTNEGSFDAAVSGATTYTFPFSGASYGGIDLGTSYSIGPATFGSPVNTGFANGDALIGFDDAYGTPYLAAFGDPLSATTSASAIGFFFGSFDGPQTITYDAGGLSGTLDVPQHNATTFLGFTGLVGPVTLTFSNNQELDTTKFVVGSSVSALPEPSTWAFALVGFAGTGVVLRRKRKRNLAPA